MSYAHLSQYLEIKAPPPQGRAKFTARRQTAM
jgi:hypothetical protein